MIEFIAITALPPWWRDLPPYESAPLIDMSDFIFWPPNHPKPE